MGFFILYWQKFLCSSWERRVQFNELSLPSDSLILDLSGNLKTDSECARLRDFIKGKEWQMLFIS